MESCAYSNPYNSEAVTYVSNSLSGAGTWQTWRFSGSCPWKTGTCREFLFQHTYWSFSNCSGSLSLSLDGRFAATFGLSNFFEVHDLKSGTVQNLQWKAPTVQPKLTKNRPVCFAHEGFAVAGAASDMKVLVWDTEHGDQLLSLNHGSEYAHIWEG